MLPKSAENDSGSQEHCNGDDIAESTKQSSSSKEDKQQNLLRPATGKFIYITRSQPDVVTSFYYHLSNQKEGTYTNGYKSFVLDWMAGEVAFGSSLHHLLSFVNGFVDNEYASSTTDALTSKPEEDTTEHHEQPPLLLSYEALKHDLHTEVQRIISFLNLKHIPKHILETQLLPSFTFQSMKSNSSKFQPKSVTWLNNYQFLRKGTIGDGRESMMTTKVYDKETEKGKEVSLLELFHDWVKDEGYREHIEELMECGRLEKKIGDQFLALVD